MRFSNSPPFSVNGFLCLLWLSFFSLPAFSEWQGNIRFMTEYIYRGYSKSRGQPVVQAHINYYHQSGWFAGLGVSQVRFDDQANGQRAEIEFRPSLGWKLPLSTEVQSRFFVTGYIFDNKLFGQRAEYAELYAALDYQDWLSFTASLAPNAYQRGANVANYELNLRHDLTDSLQLSGGFGFHQAGGLLHHDYPYWNAGATWYITSYLALDARYAAAELSSEDEGEYHLNEFYPRPQENHYLLSLTLGF